MCLYWEGYMPVPQAITLKDMSRYMPHQGLRERTRRIKQRPPQQVDINLGE